MIVVDSEVTLGERTVSRIQAALRDHQTPCIGQVVELIREMTNRPDSISIQHLAELIERDVALVAEVLRIANTIGYNPEGVDILTVPQAIQVIGFIKIRNLAVSLLLLQHANRPDTLLEARSMAVLAVTCGHLAEVTSEQLHLAEVGHGFVCAALRRYGELLLSTFLPAEYREARNLHAGNPPQDGWMTVFGLGLLDLSRRVLASMNLPQGILTTLRDLPSPAELKSLPEDDARMAAALDLSMRVANWIAGDPPLGKSFDSLAADLTKHHGAVLDLPKGGLQEILKEVDRRLSVLRGPLGNLPVFDRIRAASLGRPIRPPTTSPAVRRSVPGAITTSKRVDAPRPTEAGSTLLDGISVLGDLLAVTPIRGSQMFMAAARCVSGALDLLDVWVFRRQASTGPLVPFLGAGPLFPQLPVKALIDPSERSVFSVCLLRAETVLLSRPQDPRIRPFVPKWLATITADAPLLLLPVGRPGEVCAILCGIGEPGQLQELPTGVRQQLQVLAKLLSLARDA